MPLYWFHIDVPRQPNVLSERLRSVVRAEPDILEYFGRMWTWKKPIGPPFIGSVQAESFAIRRDIRGRNSFLPRIRGRIIPTPTGSRIDVIMFLHPFTALFMILWLGIVGNVALMATSRSALILAGMFFIFAVALTAGGFFPKL